MKRSFRILLLCFLSLCSSSALLKNLRSHNQPPITSTAIDTILPTPINSTSLTDTKDVMSDIHSVLTSSSAHSASLEKQIEDLQKHEEKHHSSVQMLQQHQHQLEQLRSILNNASKVLSVHLEHAQKNERTSVGDNVAQLLNNTMEMEVERRVNESMEILQTKMMERIDRLLDVATSKLSDTAIIMARQAIRKEVEDATVDVLSPPYAHGLVELVQREVNVEMDNRLETTVLKEVDNVTAGVINGLQWKQETGVHVIDLETTTASASAAESDAAMDGGESGWSLQAANSSRFKRTNNLLATTMPTVMRQDGYLLNPQMDPITGKPLYSYDVKDDVLGPMHWGEIISEYRTCSSGKHQSPVDVRTLAPPLNMETNVRYDPYLSGIKLEYDSLTSLSLQNVGHSLILPIRMTTPATQSDAGTWTLTHGARQYDLESMTFHVAGEHTYDGKRPSMEMHLIHRAHDAGARGSSHRHAVLVIPFYTNGGSSSTDGDSERDGDNFLDLFWDEIPPAGEQQDLTSTSLNLLSALFPEIHAVTNSYGRLLDLDADMFYSYDGSSSSPPCDETVKYFLMKSEAFHHRVSSKQVERLSQSMSETTNARPIQNDKWGQKRDVGVDGDYLEILTKADYIERPRMKREGDGGALAGASAAGAGTSGGTAGAAGASVDSSNLVVESKSEAAEGAPPAATPPADSSNDDDGAAQQAPQYAKAGDIDTSAASSVVSELEAVKRR